MYTHSRAPLSCSTAARARRGVRADAGAAHRPCTGAVEHAAEYVLTVQAGTGEAVSELALTG